MDSCSPESFFILPFSTEYPVQSQNSGTTEGDGRGDPVTVWTKPRRKKVTSVSRSLGKGKGVVISKAKRAKKSASTSSASSSCSSSSSRRRLQQKRTPLGGRDDDSLPDLALALGMCFAAIVSKVLDVKKASIDQIPVDHLYMICTSAIKESVSNINWDGFDRFLINFEKSFGSTLGTLRSISHTSGVGQGNRSIKQVLTDKQRNRSIKQVSTDEQGNRSDNEPFIDEKVHISSGSFESSSCEAALATPESPDAVIEEFQENHPLNSMNSQLILHGQTNLRLAHSASHSIGGPGFGNSIMNTFEKSVMEQTRSNDLKAFEINLIMRKLQLKQSQLALNSYANLLEKIKISMGISKASFKEEKLRNQVQDARYTELLKRCIDLLVTGLVIMSAFLAYGAFTFSYSLITETTSSCMATPKESKSWWIPKPVASFSSGWQMLRCHVVALSRISFGLLMILAVAYSAFQRSATSASTMPVTFILLLLGFACGIAGKLCVDTLGGSGYHWLLYWEALCFLHFFANVFPSALYRLLYGPIIVSQRGANAVKLFPYWLRRYTFYSILLVILPTIAGLLPFASLSDWKEHFSEKITLWSSGIENED